MTYQRAYPLLTELHMLNELEKSWCFLKSNDKTTQHQILKQWDQRLLITQPSFKIRDPILNLRLRICNFFNFKDEVGNRWLEIAKASRSGHQLTHATYALLKASTFEQTPRYHLEMSKCLWAEGKQDQAVRILQRELNHSGTSDNNRDKINLEFSLPNDLVVTSDTTVHFLQSNSWRIIFFLRSIRPLSRVSKATKKSLSANPKSMVLTAANFLPPISEFS